MDLNAVFCRMLEEAIGRENAAVAFSAFDDAALCSVRLNPFKQLDEACLPQGKSVGWSRWGRLLTERPKFTLDPAFHGGCYYVQDSSSMFVGQIFRELAGALNMCGGRVLRVLDLCAAPGGKTTDLAASLREICGDRFLLVANEVMKQRVGVLADNVALWGDPNVVVTSDDPGRFAALAGWFDFIIADVPCSGEGMFRKDEQAVAMWSADNVALCQSRQRRIVADVWNALAPEGMLIYSTCTFNRHENDENVKWIADNLGAEILSHSCFGEFEGVIPTEYGYSLVPGFVAGEGQYCAAMRKKPSEFEYIIPSKSGRLRDSVTVDKVMARRIKEMFSIDVDLRVKGETVTAVPSGLADDIAVLESCLHVVSAGVAVGVIKGRDLVPDADLALSVVLREDAFKTAVVDKATALKFLHRDNILLPDTEKGYVLIKYGAQGIGFVKNLGNRCNNLHPQSRRIRMDV